MYTAEEKETICLFDFISNTWEVYSCVPRHMTRIRKIADPFWEEKTDGKVTAAKWKLSSSQVRFATERVTKMSDEQKEARSLRMQQYHQNRNLEVMK